MSDNRRYCVIEYDEDADPDYPTWPVDVHGPFDGNVQAENWAEHAQAQGMIGEFDIMPMKAP